MDNDITLAEMVAEMVAEMRRRGWILREESGLNLKRRWRPSKRRVKARAKMGRWIPRTQIKEHRLSDWATWETKFDYDVCRMVTPEREARPVYYFAGLGQEAAGG